MCIAYINKINVVFIRNCPAWAKSNREESNRRSRNEKEFTQSPWLYVLRCAISDLCVHYTCTP